jgi:hypothetical protein
MNNPKIKFIKNWNNKLNCNYFTTIRLYNNKKFYYYEKNLAKEFDVLVKNKLYCKAILRKVSIQTLRDIISSILVYLDSGLNKIDFYNLMCRFYGEKIELTTELIILLFERIKND